MKSIVFVGAGQLGSRHLQAAKTTKENLNIFVVDKSLDSLSVAKERYEQVETEYDHKIQFLQNISEIPEKEIFAAVVATNSDVRMTVLRELLDSANIQNILLEKILFNQESAYQESLELIKSKGANAWVNCCMRMQQVYSAMVDELKGQKFNYRVTGSQYGLVTNAIHYIDHACSLEGSSQFSISTKDTDQEIIESKRPGFLELNGVISGQFKSGSNFHIECSPEGSTPVLIEIFTNQIRYVFKENEDKYWVSKESEQWKWSEESLNLKFQSQLTNLFLEALIAGEKVQLPELSESVEIHKNLLNPLKSFLVEQKTPFEVDYPFT